MDEEQEAAAIWALLRRVVLLYAEGDTEGANEQIQRAPMMHVLVATQQLAETLYQVVAEREGRDGALDTIRRVLDGIVPEHERTGLRVVGGDDLG